MTMRRNGTAVSTGLGSACLGSPVRAVAWLAATAYALGAPLRAGDIVLSGALGPMVDVHAGDQFEAEVDELGAVSVTFGSST
jgi:2-keto-4-pentenoate hydratase